MFASLQLLNAPLNHHFRQQQQMNNQQDPFQFSPSAFSFFAPQQQQQQLQQQQQQLPFIPQPVKSEESPELCLAPGLLYHEDTASSGSSCGSSSSSSSEEPSTPPPASSHARMIPQKRRSSSASESTTTPTSPSSPSHRSAPVAPSGSASPSPASTCTVTKPKRAAPAPRISSKDFIPPDVTGLSKREARLVKNRAAAFLSRQRKREEFEALEIRAAELEAENAQLRSGNPNAQILVKDSSLQAEIDRLNAELDTANRRADLLESDLARLRAVQAETQQQLVELSSSSGSSSPITTSSTDSEPEVPSSNVSSSGDSDSFTDHKELTPKNLMMALLMLLSPVLSRDPQTSSSSGSSQIGASSYEIYQPNGFISSTPFDQFLKSDSLTNFESTSFYTTADLDMNADLGFQSGAFVGTSSSSYEGGYGEMDLLKDSMSEIVHPSEPLSGMGMEINMGMMSGDGTKQAVELDLEIIRDPQNSGKVKVRLSAPFDVSGTSTGSTINTQLPQDFLSFPPSPVSGMEGVTYSFASGSNGRNAEKKRVRLSLDSTQGWNIHVEEY